jgi:hypothetical protein
MARLAPSPPKKELITIKPPKLSPPVRRGKRAWETRSCDLHVRITPTALARLQEVAVGQKASQADIIEELIMDIK